MKRPWRKYPFDLLNIGAGLSIPAPTVADRRRVKCAAINWGRRNGATVSTSCKFTPGHIVVVRLT